MVNRREGISARLQFFLYFYRFFASCNLRLALKQAADRDGHWRLQFTPGPALGRSNRPRRRSAHAKVLFFLQPVRSLAARKCEVRFRLPSETHTPPKPFWPRWCPARYPLKCYLLRALPYARPAPCMCCCCCILPVPRLHCRLSSCSCLYPALLAAAACCGRSCICMRYSPPYAAILATLCVPL
jgi:hypothetical protein